MSKDPIGPSDGGTPSSKAATIPVWLIWTLVAVQFGLGVAVPKLGTLFGCALVVTIIWFARAQYLPALIMSQPSPSDFAIGGGWETLVIGGLPFNLNYMIGVGVVLRVSWELFNRPQTFKGVYWLMIVWYMTMAPALTMSLMGRAEGNPSWTVAFRTVLMYGGFFYGIILARTWRLDGRIIMKGLLPVITIIILFVLMGFFRDKLRYIVAPAAIPFAWYAWKHGGTLQRCIAVLAFVLGTMQGIGLGIKPGEEELISLGGTSESFGVGGATLTNNGLFLGSVILTAAIAWGRPVLRRALSRVLGLPAFVFIVAFSITVAVIGAGSWATREIDQEKATFLERFQVKLFGERGRIWNTAFKDATEPPYFIKPTGRTYWIIHPLWGPIEWSAGAHNGIINTLERQRWLNGILILLLVAAAMRHNATALVRLSDSGIHAVAIAVAVTFVVGTIVNDYSLDPTGSFWVFTFAGLAARANAIHEGRSTQKIIATWRTKPAEFK